MKSEPVLVGARRQWFKILSSALASAAVFFTYSWITAAASSPDPAIALAATAMVGMAIANSLTKWLLLPRMRRPLPLRPLQEMRVAAVTTYVPGTESLEMVGATLAAIKRMKYPHDCWLLDEGDTDEAKALCRVLGISHYSRKNRPEYQRDLGTFQARSKHGNYNAWLTEIGFHRYDIVAGFDPDHIPSETFLTATLGYFADKSIGYVQSAQAYYNQPASFIARGGAEETYEYFSVIQMAAYGSGLPAVVGSHNIHRVTALKEVGGFAAHDADDLLITMLYNASGWAGVYVPAILARGLAPVDWTGYLGQQRRWARSVLDVRLHVVRTIAARLPRQSLLASYVPVLSYLQPGIMLILLLYIALETIVRGEAPTVFARLDLWSSAAVGSMLTICYFFRQSFYLDSQAEWGLHLRARLLRLAKAPFLLLAYADVLLGRRFEYAVTAKTRQKRARNPLLIPFGTIGALVAIAWAFGITFKTSYSSVAHLLAGALFALCLGLVGSYYVSTAEPFNIRLIPK